MAKNILSLVAMMFLWGTAFLSAQVVTYPWPVEAGVSDRYRVFLRCGEAPEREATVLMSKALHEGDYRAKELQGRTFSFVPVSWGPAGGPLFVRVVKLFGKGATEVTLHPRHFGLTGAMASGGSEYSFRVDRSGRYLSIHFAGADNETGECRWIKHMLCLFVDPPETEIPLRGDAGTVIYSAELSPESLRTAKRLVFSAGFHSLKTYQRGGPIDADGFLTLGSGQSVYLAGGAYVEGLIDSAPGASNQRIGGRGILSGRPYLWSDFKKLTISRGKLLGIGARGRVEGIVLMDSPHHGIVGGPRCEISGIKVLGWHCNNDGIRLNAGSTVRDSFVRAVDDHFYAMGNHISNVVLWAGHNGAILTLGWGSYATGATIMEDVDVIHPEWTGLGNNNGLVASQVSLDYRPRAMGRPDTLTTLRNIRIEGSIPGLLNLKPRWKGQNELDAPRVAQAAVGYLGDLLLENVSIDAQSGKSLLQGEARASQEGEAVFFVQNVTIRNLRIGGKLVDEAIAPRYFAIDSGTTKGIRFSGE